MAMRCHWHEPLLLLLLTLLLADHSGDASSVDAGNGIAGLTIDALGSDVGKQA